MTRIGAAASPTITPTALALSSALALLATASCAANPQQAGNAKYGESCQEDGDCEGGLACIRRFCDSATPDAGDPGDAGPTGAPDAGANAACPWFQELGVTDLECDRGWGVQDRVDPISDKREVKFVTVAPADQKYTNFLGNTVWPTVSILCSDGSALIVFITGSLETQANGSATVTIRFDQDMAETVSAVEDNWLLFFESSLSNRYAARANNAQRITLRYTPLQKFQQTTVFDVGALNGVSYIYSAVCGF